MSMTFTGNSLHFLQLLEQKARKSPPSPRCQIAIWDELAGIIPSLRLSLYQPETVERDIKEQIALYQWRGMLRIQCPWDNVNFYLGCADNYAPARLQMFQLYWKKDPVDTIPADLDELFHRRIQLLADACFNPLLRVSGIREFLMRQLEVISGDGGKDFLRELMLTLCACTLTREEKFDYDHFVKRANIYAHRIAVYRAQYQAPAPHRDLAGRCARFGANEIDDVIFELCSMIWAYLANGNALLPQTESHPQRYAFKETYSATGNITVSPILPAPDHRHCNATFRLRCDQYFEIFPTLAEAERSWSVAVNEIKQHNQEGRK